MKWLGLWLVLLSTTVYSAEKTEFELTSGGSISIDSYHSDGETLFLYLPSERGLGKGYVSTAQQLAFFGVDFVALDLHASYMIPKHRSSINRFSVKDIMELVNFSKQQGFKKLFFVTSGRGAQLALNIAYQWQLENPNSNYLRGHIFHSPHLINNKPKLGADASYVDIAKVSNLPVYLILPQFSTKHFRGEEISKQLKIGGSSVFIHRLEQVGGGFHMRNVNSLSDEDLKAKDSLGDVYLLAANLMLSVSIPKPLTLESGTNQKTTLSFSEPILKIYQGQSGMPLVLNNLSGQQIDIKDFQDTVLLINFWASWCGPCIKEIPSLVRLESLLKDQPFKIITINVGETKKEIDVFMKKVKFDLLILLDGSGKAVKDWGVYAYPSNFILDKNGIIRYTYRGALEWDSKAIVNTIKTLFF